MGSGDGLDVRFLAVYDKDNAHNLATWRECMVGRVMSQWWDQCADAGPKARETTRFQEEPPSLEILSIGSDSSCVVSLGTIR